MNTNDSALLQAFLMIVIQVVVPVLAALVSVYVGKAIQKIKLQMDAEQLAFADKVIKNLVSAAEQYDLAGAAKRSGVQKKAWVMDQAQAQLTSRGINISIPMLANLVESSILQGWNKPSSFTNTAALPAKE